MTRKDTVKSLCKQVITRLENQKQIEFSPRLRQEVWESLYMRLHGAILSDEDLREKVIEKLHIKAEALVESEMTESDQFKSALKMTKQKLGENELNGLYFQKPIRDIAQEIAGFLMSCSHIDDVFETDDVLIKGVVEMIQKFNPSELH